MECISKQKQKYVEIDTLKGIAIFLVILGHSIIVYPVNLRNNQIYNFIYQWLSSVHMPLFFMISGFCFSYNGNYRKYIFKKVQRILEPYIVFNIINLIIKNIFVTYINKKINFSIGIKNIIFYGGDYWFLYVLFIIFVIFPFFDSLFKKNKKLLFVALPVLYITNLLIPTIEVFHINNVIYFLFYFITGYLLKNTIGFKIFKYDMNKKVILPILILLLSIWIYLVYVDNTYISFIVVYVASSFIFLLTKFKIFNTFFARFGIYSLQLYLLNGYFLAISRNIAIMMLDISNPLLIIIINMVIDFLVAYLVIKNIIDKNKVFKRICGIIE